MYFTLVNIDADFCSCIFLVLKVLEDETRPPYVLFDFGFGYNMAALIGIECHRCYIKLSSLSRCLDTTLTNVCEVRNGRMFEMFLETFFNLISA
jgi:hypothetical protein